MDGYRSRDWQAFRRQVIRLDNHVCTVCGRSEKDGAILQVHHKRYIKGKKPWEYPYELCSALCKGCHAMEHGIIPPNFGWTHVGWDDLGELSGTCDCCGTSIRYVFLVQHENWHAMEVGEICCDNLTSTQVASDIMESRRRYATRLKTFASSSRWREFQGTHAIRQKGFSLMVIPSDDAFKIKVDGQLGLKVYATALDAKIAIFDLIETGILDAYKKRRREQRKPNGPFWTRDLSGK